MCKLGTRKLVVASIRGRAVETRLISSCGVGGLRGCGVATTAGKAEISSKCWQEAEYLYSQAAASQASSAALACRGRAAIGELSFRKILLYWYKSFLRGSPAASTMHLSPFFHLLSRLPIPPTVLYPRCSPLPSTATRSPQPAARPGRTRSRQRSRQAQCGGVVVVVVLCCWTDHHRSFAGAYEYQR
jgi:hypothetical protein